MRKLFFLGFLCVFSCTGFISKPTIRVGIDPTWFYTNVGKRVSVVNRINGFIQEILLEISNESGVEFELYEASWDNLLQKLNKKEFDFIVSGLIPQGSSKELYFFSEPILKTGPILVTNKDSKIDSLKDMDNKNIAFVENSPAFLLLQPYTHIQLMPEPTAALALNQLIMGKSTAALIDALIAYGYVEEVYHDILHIVGEPLGNQAIRWVCLQDKHMEACKMLEKGMNRLKRKGVFEKNLKKWGLN